MDSIGQETGTDRFGFTEGRRCLECDLICNKCVEVCPNRANIALPMDQFKDRFQVLHIDAYCNECGNCGFFCPYAYDGLPYKDKFTIFNLEEDYRASENSGFFMQENEILLRLDRIEYRIAINPDGSMRLPKTESNGNVQVKKALQIIDQVRQEHNYLLGPLV